MDASIRPACLALAAALLAAALLRPTPAAAQSVSLQQILEQQRALAAGLDARDSRLTNREKNQIRRAQEQVFSIAGGHQSLDELNVDEKVRMENALEQINALVKGGHAAQAAKEVCRRERKTGSSAKRTECGTQAERDFAREGARAYMERPRICNPPGCS